MNANRDVGSVIGFEIATNMLGASYAFGGVIWSPVRLLNGTTLGVAEIIRGESAQDAAPSRRLAVAKHQAFPSHAKMPNTLLGV
jgi:hypothetical protein